MEDLKKYNVIPMRIDECRLEQVILLVYIVGEGTEKSPIKMINEYRTLDGKTIAKLIV
ncbi:hypothetical protein [Thomasclavelia ramosa]|uniref:hypothetical protein n=1 Tax=Thomasclavelia ramosa TaxID=1547 RepID=UPI001314192D|nr:hypothetical protein [Thomasclavelia ramosa]